MEIKLEEHTVEKEHAGIKYQKSLNQSLVFVKYEGKWKHVGYYMHIPSRWQGLVSWPNELNGEMQKAIEKIVKKPVCTIDAPIPIKKVMDALDELNAEQEDDE